MAVAVARLNAADAITLCKTNVPVMLADWPSYNSMYAFRSLFCLGDAAAAGDRSGEVTLRTQHSDPTATELIHDFRSGSK